MNLDMKHTEMIEILVSNKQFKNGYKPKYSDNTLQKREIYEVPTIYFFI